MVSFNTCILFPLFQTVTTAALPHSQQPSFNDDDENDEYGDHFYIFLHLCYLLVYILILSCSGSCFLLMEKEVSMGMEWDDGYLRIMPFVNNLVQRVGNWGKYVKGLFKYCGGTFWYLRFWCFHFAGNGFSRFEQTFGKSLECLWGQAIADALQYNSIWTRYSRYRCQEMLKWWCFCSCILPETVSEIIWGKTPVEEKTWHHWMLFHSENR